jgi:adenylyltransferase/sulfurtransferase
VSVFAPHLGGPCYRCLNPHAPEAGSVPSCAEAGVLGVMPGLVGTLQALEAIKLIAGLGDPLIGRLLHIDALAMKFREFTLRRDPRCARCADGRRQLPIEAEGEFCEASGVMSDDEITVTELAALRAAADAHVLLDVREPWELAVARLDPCLTVPMGEVPQRFAEVPRDQPVYVLCHGGVRSGQVVDFLRGQGYTNVRNVRGGIAAWSAEVDASLPTY